MRRIVNNTSCITTLRVYDVLERQWLRIERSYTAKPSYNKTTTVSSWVYMVVVAISHQALAMPPVSNNPNTQYHDYGVPIRAASES